MDNERHDNPMRVRRSRFWVLAPLLGLVGLFAHAGPVDADDAAEARIKAAIVYNFTKFVAWPAPAESAVVDFPLGIVGENDMRRALEELQGKSVGEQELSIQSVSLPEELRRCRVVYFSHSISDQLPRLLEAIGDAPVLTVSDIEGFGRAGGMIELVRRKNKIRFLINPRATERAELQVSSQLLKMAELVEEE